LNKPLDPLQSALLAEVVQQMPAAVVITDPGGRLLAGNDQVARIWRQPIPTTDGVHDYGRWKGFHRDGRPLAPKEWPVARSLGGETVEREEVRIERGDGTTGILRVSSAPVRDDGGNIIAAVATFYDVTEERREQEAFAVLAAAEREQRIRAEQSERRMQQMHAATVDLSRALTVSDVCDTVLTHSHEVLQARGAVIALVDGDTLRVARARGVPTELVAQFETIPLAVDMPLSAAARRNEPLWMHDRTEALQYGELRAILSQTRSAAWAAIPLRADARCIGVLGLTFDDPQAFVIEDRNFLMSLAAQATTALERARLFESERRAREEAERASRAKDDFLAVLSHELRTPLTTVIGWTEFLRLTHADDAALLEQLSALLASAHAQAKLVDDLLDVSRIVAGKLRIDHRDVELRSVVRTAIDTLRIAAANKGVELIADLGQEDVPLHGDPDRLQQIVINLVGNGIKFTPPGGSVTVRVRGRQLTVRDTGEGIPSDFLPHVFDRFRQGSSGETRRHTGLGLGLSIVQHLVHLHGGTVHAESEGPGHGATFVVNFP
jgi:signal transduction histidine kinase